MCRQLLYQAAGLTDGGVVFSRRKKITRGRRDMYEEKKLGYNLGSLEIGAEVGLSCSNIEIRVRICVQ